MCLARLVGDPMPLSRRSALFRVNPRGIFTLLQEALERGDEAEAYKQARSSTRVDSTIIETSKDLLRLMGIPTVQAPGEGEAQASYMVMKGDASMSCRRIMTRSCLALPRSSVP